MQFTAKRDDLLGVSRKLARLLPDQSPIADLAGILLEADENSGSLRLVAINLEVTLWYRLPATVAEGGRMVVNGKLLANMMPLLGDDHVLFRKLNDTTVRVENGKAFFEISCLSGSHYPEPQTPPPDKTVKVCGLESLAGQTAFAAVKKKTHPGDMLANARLEVFPSEARMTCTDGAKLAIARHRWESAGQNAAHSHTCFLLPIKTLPLMAGVCGDVEAELGMSGSTLVITGGNYRFSTRTMQGVYPDTTALLSQVKPAYTAFMAASDLWTDLDRVSILAEPGDTVNIMLREDGIALLYQHEQKGFSSVTDAVVYSATPDGGFHYGVGDLHRTLRYLRGNLSLMIDRGGNLLMKTSELCYLLTPRRPHKAAAESGQKSDKKKKTTRGKKAA